MKALIVDDEKHVIEAIKLLVDWNKFNIDELYEASNGEEAINIIKQHNPQIIFTDMKMPKKNGAELLEWILSNAKGSKTIAISGYNDFEYVRHVMKCGGIDYILKPIDPSQLEEAVERAVKSLNNDNKFRERSVKVNELTPLYWSKLFSDIINDINSHQTEFKKIIDEFKIPIKCICQIAVIKILNLKGKIKEQFKDDKDLLFFSIINVCNEIIREKNSGYSFNHINSNEIIIIFWNNIDDTESIINKIYSCLFKLFGNNFEIGIGTKEKFPTNLLTSYHNANTALMQRNLLSNSIKIHTFSKKINSNLLIDLSSLENELILAIKSNNFNIINTMIEKIFVQFKRGKIFTVENMEFLYNEYELLRVHIISKLSLNNSNLAKFNSIKDLNNLFLLDKIKNQILKDLNNITNTYILTGNMKNNIIYDIKKYIETYYNKDISLNKLSKKFYISKEHLSRKFKKETGQTISIYIAHIRIEKAKTLLNNSNYTLAEIADMVGYGDKKYFSKVFKKITNITPNEFRKNFKTNIQPK